MSDLHDQIRQQYASDRGRQFYQTVMGDGGFDIHYGLYADASTTMRQATQAATKRLLKLAIEILPKSEITSVLDLGSGRGGPAHFLATACDATITCVDLCQRHHEENLRQAEESGISKRIDTWLGSFESLPQDWRERFDMTWGQESFCHASDIAQVVHQAHRVTCVGGVIAFSDILLSADASDSQAEAFSDVNAVIRLSTKQRYTDLLAEVGFTEIEFEDWTPSLKANFDRMLEQIGRSRDSLVRSGVQETYLAQFSAALRERINWAEGSVLQWGAFVGRRG